MVVDNPAGKKGSRDVTKKTRSRLHWLLITAVVILITGYAVYSFKKEKTPDLLTAPVTRNTLQETVRAIGTLQPIRRVDVGSQASGQLKKLLVKAGAKVQEGQLLAELDPTLSQNVLLDAQVALGALLAQKKATEAQVRKSRLSLQRQRDMFQQKAAARQDLEAAEAEMQLQQSQLVVIIAQIRQQQLRVDNAKTNLGYTRIVAPVSGTVLQVLTEEGQTVVASYQIPIILKIADLTTMTVRAQIPEADIARLSLGMKACFTSLGYNSQSFCSTLKTLEPAPEKINNALFFNALFDVDNQSGKLRPEMTAQVIVVLSEAEKALSIPLTALGENLAQDRYQVSVVGADGRPVAREVHTGIDNSQRVEIKDGLREGENVVMGHYLTPGGK
ncbi:efflux RND transporter periplasmic adaptor subunit [Pseudomonas fluorescens]|uniref:efflux RND transporter periplasmic adaptor subunit n=1 Tax=Pseudomonas fluorescens TaxID=294 RepID=UPI001BEC335C|nr:efflux RND transporter periplasmic adaptor subunit [Pseudomonas fluorescens]MBT2373905.1 efflux RND transporter periplasmic adaptor subunit [Pseudomonas fluorescens]